MMSEEKNVPTEMKDLFPQIEEMQARAGFERVEKNVQKWKDRVAGPSMNVSIEDNVLNIEYAGDKATATVLLMTDMGTCDTDFFNGLQTQIATIGSHGRRVNSSASNFIMSVVRSVQPNDEIEAMLATQMGAIHAATMMMARRLNHVENIPQQDAAERALNKLARTFATQMETLKRYRTGGQQKMTVEHVTVNEGGQAIVGNVSAGGRGNVKS